MEDVIARESSRAAAGRECLLAHRAWPLSPRHLHLRKGGDGRSGRGHAEEVGALRELVVEDLISEVAETLARRGSGEVVRRRGRHAHDDGVDAGAEGEEFVDAVLG